MVEWTDATKGGRGAGWKGGQVEGRERGQEEEGRRGTDGPLLRGGRRRPVSLPHTKDACSDSTWGPASPPPSAPAQLGEENRLR